MRGYNVEEVTNLSGWPQYTHLSNEKGLDWIVSIISKISYPQTLSLKSNYPFPFITEIKYAGKSHSVVSDSLQPHGLIHGILILILIHGILQARILEWVAILFSRGSSQLRDRTQDSFIAGGFFTNWVTRETQEYWNGWPIPSPGDLPDPGFEPGSPAWQADSRWATRETPWSQHIRYPAYIPENQNIWKAHKTEKLPGMARRNQFLRRESCTFNPFFGGSQKSRTLL